MRGGTWSKVSIIAGIVGFFMVLCVFSCGEQGGESVPAFDPEKNYTITIGVYPDLDAAYQAVFDSDEFKTAFPNITVQIVSEDWQVHHDRLTTVLAAGSGANDIEAIDEGYLANFKAGGFVDLGKAPYKGREAGKDLIPYAMTSATTEDGKLIALPVDASPTVIFYRKSVADAAGVDFSAIATFDDLIEAAKKMSADTDGDGNNDRFAFASAMEISLMRLNNAIGAWVDESGKVMADKEKFLGQLELVRKINDHKVHANMQEWTDPWIEAYPNGTVSMAIIGAWFEGALKTWMAPDLSGDWRVVMLPEGINCNYGGSFLGIPTSTSADKRMAAWAVLTYLCTNANAQLTSLKTIGSTPALKTVWNDPCMDEPIEYLGGQKARLLYIKAVGDIPVVKPSKYDQIGKTTWQNVIEKLLAGELTIDGAYEDVKAKIQAQM